MNTQKRHDVCVIGGGPAGCVAAFHLARAGFNARLLALSFWITSLGKWESRGQKVSGRRGLPSATTVFRVAGIVTGCAAFMLLAHMKLEAVRTQQAGLNDPVSKKYGFSVARLYGGMKADQVGELLRETWGRSLVPGPEGRLQEAPFRGRFVTVSLQGFREVPRQGPWPPQRDRYYTVFLFGGSTAFNYGVADAETIAAKLQQKLEHTPLSKPPKVYNFGVAFYTSTEERQLFEALVRQETLPDLAIFLDGTNDFHCARDAPPQAPHVEASLVKPSEDRWAELKGRLKDSRLGGLLREWRNYFLEISLDRNLHDAQVVSSLSSTAAVETHQRSSLSAVTPSFSVEEPKEGAPHATTMETVAASAASNAVLSVSVQYKKLVQSLFANLASKVIKQYYGSRPLILKVIQRYLANKHSIEVLAASAGVQTLFVWQPVPTYKYDLRYHPFAAGGFGHHTYSIFGYPITRELFDAHPPGDNFLWCADIQEHSTEPLYSDKVHYSARLSDMVADCIAAGLSPKGTR